MQIHIVAECENQTLDFAARELRRYLEHMLSGYDGQVRITLLPQAERDTDLRESFAVNLTPSGGSISGSGPRAVLLGVYDCLRTLGCRFLGPRPELERVPRVEPQALSLRYEKRAAFAHRGVCIEGADSLENILDFIDWLPKVGYNAFFSQFKTPYAFLKRWYHHENNPLRAAEPYSEADAERDMRAVEREVRRRGLMLHGAGHGWTGEVLGFDAVSWDAHGGALPEEKRKLAAEVGGVRGLFRGVPANTNLCLSNPDSRRAFAGCVADYAAGHPDTDYLHVWLADEYNNVCECAACRETTPSDQYVELLNDIDSMLTRRGLDTRIVFLLYQELLWPPVRARLNNPERFVLMFAPISRSFESSYELDGVPDRPPEYVRNRITLPRGIGENLSFLRAWREAFSGEGFAYDYHLGRAHYGDFGYLHISRVISADIKKLRAMGLSGSISCQELRACLPNALPNYVMGYTLFDDGADVDGLIDEYFSAAYGGDRQAVREYLERLSSLECCDYVNGAGARENPEAAQRASEVQKLCGEFTPPDTEDAFAGLLSCHRRYTLRLARALELLALGKRKEAADAWREMREFICAGEPRFQPYLDVYRVLDVTAKFTGFPVSE